MRALVTGGAGFIGSYLVDGLLASGHEVRVLDSLDPQVHNGPPDYLSAEAELIIGDVRDHGAVSGALEGVDRLFHLAAAVGVGQSMYEIERYTSINAIGAAVVLEEGMRVRDRLEKAVVASSMSIYGEGLYRCDNEGTDVAPPPRPAAQLTAHEWEVKCPSCGRNLRPVPTPETKPLAPTSIYAVNKRDHEEMFLAWGAAYGVPATALRFFNVYGPRQALSNPYTGVAAIFAARLLNRRAPVVFEDGLQTRDFVHASDIASAIVAASEPGRGDGAALNVSAGTPIAVIDIARILAERLGVEVEPEVRAEYRAGDIRHCVGDSTRARTELGWASVVDFEAGIANLVEWLAEQNAVDRVDVATDALVSRGLAR